MAKVPTSPQTDNTDGSGIVFYSPHNCRPAPKEPKRVACISISAAGRVALNSAAIDKLALKPGETVALGQYVDPNSKRSDWYLVRYTGGFTLNGKAGKGELSFSNAVLARRFLDSLHKEDKKLVRLALATEPTILGEQSLYAIITLNVLAEK